MPEDKKDYDGFVIVPENTEESKIVFFHLNDGAEKGTPIENTELGDKYHVVYFKLNSSKDDIEFDDTFEAIFVDPVYYAKRLLPSFYCMIVRKTDKSVAWFEEYLRELLERAILSKVKNYKAALESIANN
jgi:hypothetical protein